MDALRRKRLALEQFFHCDLNLSPRKVHKWMGPVPFCNRTYWDCWVYYWTWPIPMGEGLYWGCRTSVFQADYHRKYLRFLADEKVLILPGVYRSLMVQASPPVEVVSCSVENLHSLLVLKNFVKALTPVFVVPLWLLSDVYFQSRALEGRLVLSSTVASRLADCFDFRLVLYVAYWHVADLPYWSN